MHKKNKMSLLKNLEIRSQGNCELCETSVAKIIYLVPHGEGAELDINVHLCEKCSSQIEIKEELDSNYWASFLPTTMWTQVPAVQVVAWRMLNRFREETWAADALEMLYLEDSILEWAKASGEHLSNVEDSLHRDCNGALLVAGDSVSLIKDLDVKGSTLNAKMGTTVRNIRLDPNNPEFIEGRVEGQNIVILTKFVRKLN